MAWRRPAGWLGLAGLIVAAVTAAPAAGQDAVSYQQDASHTGRLTTAALAPPLTQRWSRDLGDYTSYPLIVGERVFVTALESEAAGPVLHALDLGTGEELWSRRLGGDSAALPGYHAGRLLIQDDDGLVRAYDPPPASGCGRRWSATTTTRDRPWVPTAWCSRGTGGRSTRSRDCRAGRSPAMAGHIRGRWSPTVA
jgi:hypothetical protein